MPVKKYNGSLAFPFIFPQLHGRGMSSPRRRLSQPSHSESVTNAARILKSTPMSPSTSGRAQDVFGNGAGKGKGYRGMEANLSFVHPDEEHVTITDCTAVGKKGSRNPQSRRGALHHPLVPLGQERAQLRGPASDLAAQADRSGFLGSEGELTEQDGERLIQQLVAAFSMLTDSQRARLVEEQNTIMKREASSRPGEQGTWTQNVHGGSGQPSGGQLSGDQPVHSKPHARQIMKQTGSLVR